MMKRKYRVILLAALVLGWMGVIFMFSSQDGAASSETSGRVVERVIAVVKPDFNSQKERTDQISGDGHIFCTQGSAFYRIHDSGRASFFILL